MYIQILIISNIYIYIDKYSLLGIPIALMSRGRFSKLTPTWFNDAQIERTPERELRRTITRIALNDLNLDIQSKGSTVEHIQMVFQLPLRASSFASDTIEKIHGELHTTSRSHKDPVDMYIIFTYIHIYIYTYIHIYLYVHLHDILTYIHTCIAYCLFLADLA